MLNHFTRLKKLEDLLTGGDSGILYYGHLTVFSDKSYEETFLLKENKNSKIIGAKRGKKYIQVSLDDSPSLFPIMKALYAETQNELIAEKCRMTFVFNNFYLDEDSKPIFASPRLNLDFEKCGLQSSGSC